MSKVRKRYGKGIKFQAALSMIKGEKTVAEISSEYQVHAGVLNRWKKELLSHGPDIFDMKRGGSENEDSHIGDLQKKIGQLTMEIEFLKKVSRHLT